MGVITKWEKWEWIPQPAGGHLYDYKETQLFAEIHFELAWHIKLHRRYDKIVLNKEYRIEDVDAAKRFTETMLAEQHLDKNWKKLNETQYRLYDKKGRELSTLNYDDKAEKWHAAVLRREHETMLDEQIGFGQIQKVKKLTETLIEASTDYSLQEILNAFNKENGIE